MINSPTQEVIEAERKERKQVFKSFIIIGCLEAIFSISLLICGISGAVYGKSDYYAGAFIAGGFFLLKGIYFINFYMKGISSKTDDNVVLSQLVCNILMGDVVWTRTQHYSLNCLYTAARF
ncbi:uncharacterized protein LOC143071863 isoform X3 [Mytilus galloprovincialis]|uniref:uncharacterized protein LOC143071863 isoform X3 n=1 Tax=Mytilus galloprovincialis TaxID=29158 RepID=UPI003F7C7403